MGPTGPHWLVSSFELCETVLRSPVSVDRGNLFDVVPCSKLRGPIALPVTKP